MKRPGPIHFMICFVILSLVVIVFFLPMFYSGPNAPTVVGRALLVGAATLAAILSCHTAPAAKQKLAKRLWIGLLTIIVLASIVTYWTSWNNYRTFRAVWDSRSGLMNLSTATKFYQQERGAIPTSFMLLVPEQYLDGKVFLVRTTSTRLADVQTGGMSLADLEAGRVTPEAFIAAVNANPPNGQWERIGDFLISRDNNAWKSSRSDIAVGIGPPLPAQQCMVLWADGQVDLVVLDAEWLFKQNLVQKGCFPQ